MRLIDADALIKSMKSHAVKDNGLTNDYKAGLTDSIRIAVALAENAPTIDAAGGRCRKMTDAKWELGRLTLGKDERSGHRKTKTHKWICFERLAYYEDLEEQGRLVVLPCKVGTRVWVIGQNCDLCRDMYAEEPCLFGDCEHKGVFESAFCYGMVNGFGATVFLTRAEAEAALKGVEK